MTKAALQFFCESLQSLDMARFNDLARRDQQAVISQAKSELIAEFPSWANDHNWASYKGVALREKVVEILKRRP